MVETRLAGVSPEPIHKHAVKINETWFPVVQAFEHALGVARSEFITDTARRHLTALGFELRGNRKTRPAHNNNPTSQPAQPPAHVGVAAEWFSKASVQTAAVAALPDAGWRTVAVSATAAKRGMVVIAERGGQTPGLAVTGFPGGGTIDP